MSLYNCIVNLPSLLQTILKTRERSNLSVITCLHRFALVSATDVVFALETFRDYFILRRRNEVESWKEIFRIY